MRNEDYARAKCRYPRSEGGPGEEPAPLEVEVR